MDAFLLSCGQRDESLKIKSILLFFNRLGCQSIDILHCKVNYYSIGGKDLNANNQRIYRKIKRQAM
jgi:hypothetical protein